MSFLQAPSVVWGLLVTTAFVVLIGGRRRLLAGIAGAAMVFVLLLETITPGISWSPYYKIKTTDGAYSGVPFTDISVNGVPHQIMRPAAPRLSEEPQYGLPYQRTPGNPLKNVLPSWRTRVSATTSPTTRPSSTTASTPRAPPAS